MKIAERLITFCAGAGLMALGGTFLCFFIIILYVIHEVYQNIGINVFVNMQKKDKIDD